MTIENKNSHNLNTQPIEDNIFRTDNMQYLSLISKYDAVIKKIKVKLEILGDDIELNTGRNPIQSIRTRIKTNQSILNKLHRLGEEISLESMEKNLFDVAGIRVTCLFIDEVYKLAELLENQDDIKLIRVKDYIKNPKENGYRSYHIIVQTPIYLSNSTYPMKIEIQLRTVAMDYWATLEHKLKYKKNIPNQDKIIAELKECADTITETDLKMLKIKNQINRM